MTEPRPFQSMPTGDLLLLHVGLHLHDPERAGPADGGAVVRRLLTHYVEAEIRARQIAFGAELRRVLDDGLARLRQAMTADEVVEIIRGG